MTANRLVAFLTPIFVGLAGYIVSWVAEHFPGAPNLDKDQLTALFVLGGLSAFGSAVKWLHGWQKHEENLTVLAVHAQPPANQVAAGQVTDKDSKSV